MAKRLEGIPDVDVVIATRDGFAELSRKNSVSITDGILGNKIVLDNGAVLWSSTNISSYIYVFDNGTEIAHYAYTNLKYYKNCVEVQRLPFHFTATGVSGVTGTIHKIEIYNIDKSLEFLHIDYHKESRFW